MTNTSEKTESHKQTYAGGCHCGAVRFEAEIDLAKPVTRCNCSICQKIGNTGTTVAPSELRQTAGAEVTGEYRVTPDSPNFRVFCTRCGVQCFGRGDVPALGGAFASVNVNCLDHVDLSKLTILHWDGRHDNWMAGTRAEPWPTIRS